MTALIVIGSILLFLFLLTLFHVNFVAEYNGEIQLQVRYMFLKFNILPEKEKEEKPNEDEPSADPEAEKKKSSPSKIKVFLKNEGVNGVLGFLNELVKIIKNLSSYTLKHLKIKKFDLYIVVADEDAASAALKYGEISAAASAVYGMLFSFKHCKDPRISVDLDYNAKDILMQLNGKLSIRLLSVIILAFKALIKGLPLVKRFLNSSKEIEAPKKDTSLKATKNTKEDGIKETKA